MSLVKIQGDPSGTGTLTIAAPNTSSNYTLTLPTATGTLLSSASTSGFPAGTVKQVVTATYGTSSTTTSTSFVTTNLTASITPSSASNKILIIVSLPVSSPTTGTYSAFYTIFRGTTAGTNLGHVTAGFSAFGVFLNTTGQFVQGTIPLNYLDSPSTTSSQTYTVAARSEGNNSAAGWCQGSATATIILMEIAA